MRRLACAMMLLVSAGSLAGYAMPSTGVPTPYGYATSRTFSIGNAEVHQNRKLFQGEMIGRDFQLRLDAAGEISGLSSDEEIANALGIISRALGGI